MSVAVESLTTEFEAFVARPDVDPRPLYARLRETAPVFRTSFGFWFVTRYDLCQSILRNDAGWSVSESSGHKGTTPGFAFEVMARMVLTMDGLDHTRLRRLVSTIFAGRGAERLRAGVIASVETQLDSLGDRSEVELFSDFAQMLPTRVILDVLGIGHEHVPTFVAVADALIAMHEPTADAATVADANVSFQRAADVVVELAGERKIAPGNDLLTSLVEAGEDSEQLSDDELVAMVLILVIAGHETTANTLCTGMLHLLERPDRLVELRADRSLIPSAVEELLRLDAATRNSVARYAVEDIEVGGQLIRKGEKLYVCLHAANHDPAEFPDPLTLDLRRAPNRHMGFGGGAHYCLGASVARMELQVAIGALLDRYPIIELAGVPTWRRSFIIRGLETLPLRLKTAGGD